MDPANLMGLVSLVSLERLTIERQESYCRR